METGPAAQPQTVGIRELKQNPSEIIARAATGVRFEVLSNGKPVGVVIQREAGVRRRWVSTDALAALSADAHSGLTGTGGALPSSDSTGWGDELREDRERDQHSDPIVDPWDTSSRASSDSQTDQVAQ